MTTSRQTPSTASERREAAARWEVPEPLAMVEVQMDDGTPITLRRHGNPQGMRLVVSHANGLSADAYYPFWSLLADRFDLILYDFRNHGWNPVGDLVAHDIATFVRDNARIVQAIDRHFGERPKIGVFHSVSAQTAVLQAASGGGFSALVLFDPFICPPGCAPQHLETLGATMDQLDGGARRRRETFDTEEAFAERIRRAPAFKRLVPGAADLIARTTLRRAPGGTGYELRCPRDYEAKIYQQAFRWARTVEIDRLSCPAKAIGADPAVPFSFMPTVDLSEILILDYDFVPETTHFLQLEEPQVCVDLMLDFLAQSFPEATR